MPNIIIASKNPHKIKKISQILEPYFESIASLLDYPDSPEIEENETTFLENAKLKARELSKNFDTWVIATDTGATIPALGSNWNKLHTKRFVGEGKSDTDRIQAMLKLMKSKKDRRIWMSEAVALYHKGTLKHSIEVNSPIGQIKQEWNGKHQPGAWLLSLWYLPHWQKDFLDLTPEEVNQEENTWHEIKNSLNKFFNERKISK